MVSTGAKFLNLEGALQKNKTKKNNLCCRRFFELQSFNRLLVFETTFSWISVNPQTKLVHIHRVVVDTTGKLVTDFGIVLIQLFSRLNWSGVGIEKMYSVKRNFFVGRLSLSPKLGEESKKWIYTQWIVYEMSFRLT